jgi:hypothetical protein
VDATASFGLPAGFEDARAAVFFDFEGDDDLDLLVLRDRHPSALFILEGRRYTDAAARLGFKTSGGAYAAGVFDFDGDGDLDIYVGYSGKPGTEPSAGGRDGVANQLWRNDGTRLVEIGEAAGVADTGWARSVIHFDHDEDGDQDLMVGNDAGPNVMFENLGDGTFSEVAAPWRVAGFEGTSSLSLTDANGDGRWDVYVAGMDMYPRTVRVFLPLEKETVDPDRMIKAAHLSRSGNKLLVRTEDEYRNEEAVRFEPGARGWGFGARFFDYENDGDEDMALATGWVPGSPAANQRNQLYLYHQGLYHLAPTRDASAFRGNSRALALIDIDRDGDEDLIVAGYDELARVLKNVQHKRNRWVGLRLRAAGKNTRAIGASVEVSTGSGRVFRQVSCSAGHLSQPDSTLTVGVGSARTVDLVIQWPDGSRSEHPELATGTVHDIAQEGS